MDVFIQGKRTRTGSLDTKGRGGEAEVFDLGNGKVLKLFKPPHHPDYTGDAIAQEGARIRLAEHQEKLKAFPRAMPSHVVVPEDLALDAGGRIVGYIMKFIDNAHLLVQYTDKSFRQLGVPQTTVVDIFRDIYATVEQVHSARVVIGDFTDVNVLIKNNEAYFIDADSFQFNRFFCKTFTTKFVDPLLCDPQSKSLMLIKPHTIYSDWYAFSVMLMWCLLYVDPYGGVYRPKNRANTMNHDARPLHRITVFHPEVIYPKPAISYTLLPDDLLQYFHLVFEKDARKEFPKTLLETLRWTKCSQCNTEHARSVCPQCATAAPAAIKEVITIRGTVKANRIFRTTGTILFAAVQNGKLKWLYHENGQFKREDESMATSGTLDRDMRFRIQDESTLIAKGDQLIVFKNQQKPVVVPVDRYGLLPIFDANGDNYFWTENGQLMKNGEWTSELIGSVLRNQTLFWVGPAFGFGFYRAGDFSVAFVFDAAHKGINDTVQFPVIKGQLLDSTCVFTKDRCWFFMALREGGKTIHRCMVVTAQGKIEATAETEQGDGSWLGEPIRGKCAMGNFLFVPTDNGITRVDCANGAVSVAREFPDSEPFIDSRTQLFADNKGIYAISRNEITVLTMK